MHKHGWFRLYKPSQASQPPTHLAGETANSFTLALALAFTICIHNLHYLHFHRAHKFGLPSASFPSPSPCQLCALCN